MENFLKNISSWLQFGGAMVTVLSALGFGFIEHHKYKPNKKTFAIIACVGGFLSAFGAYYSGKDADEKTKAIIEQGEKIKEVQSRQTQNLDDLIIKSERRTVESLIERGRILDEFDKVSAKLNKITENEKQKLELEKPEISVFKDPVFLLKDTIKNKYSIYLELVNGRERTAEKVDISAIILELSNEKIDTHIIIDNKYKPTNPFTSIPPVSRTKTGTGVFWNGIELPNHIRLENYSKSIIFVINIKYQDLYEDETHNRPFYFIWRSYDRDGFRLSQCSGFVYTLVAEYLKKNNIKF